MLAEHLGESGFIGAEWIAVFMGPEIYQCRGGDLFKNTVLEIKINLECKYLFRMRKSKYVTELRKLTINTTVRKDPEK